MKALITGGTSGIGCGVAQQLAEAGWEVTIVGRDRERGHQIAAEIGAQFIPADLSLMAENHRLANDIRDTLDALVLCAGVLSMSSTQQRTIEGYELNFATNYLGRYVLSQLLLSKMASGGCIALVSGNGKYKGIPTNWANPQSGMNAARTAALAVDLYAAELAKQAPHLRIHTCYPGIVKTSLLRDTPWLMRLFVQLAGTNVQQGSSHLTTLVTQRHQDIHWDQNNPMRFVPPLPADASGLLDYSRQVLENYKEHA